MNDVKVIAFDLDGTLTQHKSKLGAENRAVLEKLAKKYKLLRVGAGQCRRIFEQMEHFPIDIIGNYGLQYAKYSSETKDIEIVRREEIDCDRESVDARVTQLRHDYGFTEYKGENVEFHPSGCVTIPILGTKADLADKLAYDPDRKKRRAIYEDVCKRFSDYIVFVGGSSSFDMAPSPFNKYYALDRYCKENHLSHENVVFVGDDYGMGGNDESVYKSDFTFVCVDHYQELADKLKAYLED